MEIVDVSDDSGDTVMPLTVRRMYTPFIHKRRTTGPAGMGWILPWW